ncbi:hypothetical protein [Chondromyces crocatus]|uniref:Uncharacterized protein n=1 Tax=Chondromyces crocatus TaxID=52 RepID=A0A0K1EQS8_CHOCO|nr:hypothetical protein [Chondromyces crocatus]AKT43164.1 uncharacterized protein CMC5_073940 [Chondromyces crocatus]
MGSIDYSRFSRVLERCEEVASEPGMKMSVVRVYEGALREAATAFLAAHEAVKKSEASYRREQREPAGALLTLDRPYREVRARVLAFAPESVLPDSLRVQQSDMERLDAIEKMIDTLDDHAGETWADELAQGTFGQLAARTVKVLNEASSTDWRLAAAQEARAAGYGPAFERYLRFKRAVREALGPKSRQFQRIHLRTPNSADTGPETQPEPRGEPPPSLPLGSVEAIPPTERVGRAAPPAQFGILKRSEVPPPG